MLAIAATYTDFLLFAQFAFLDHLQASLDRAGVETAMAAMGIAGLLGSFATAWLLGRVDGRRLLPFAFLAASGVALLACWLVAPAALRVGAAAIGAVTALLTVTLAADLATWVERRHLGLTVGLGTGLAYLLCNVPSLFEASAMARSLFVAGVTFVAAIGLAVTVAADPDPGLGTGDPDHADDMSAADKHSMSAADPAQASGAPGAHTLRAFVAVVLSVLVLVWLDSAAFAVIQESAAHLSLTWGGERKVLQGIVHALAAVAAGVALDRGLLRGVLASTAVAFGIALPVIETVATGTGGASADMGRLALLAALAGPLYAVGISLYSSALVACPSLGPRPAGLARRWSAAWLFGIAGWLGSALGVGMAQDLHRVPHLFVAVAVALVLGAWWLDRRRPSDRPGRLLTTHALPVLCLLGALGVYGLDLDHRPFDHRPHDAPPSVSDRSSLVGAGRRVYIAEGCIHCHSQYIRPRVPADARWGEPVPFDRDATPPLGGARRQGPDLTHAGGRHDAAWHRRHLLDPRAEEPTSSMPSYAHLFAGDGRRGEALVAYLVSLGVEGDDIESDDRSDSTP